MKRAMWKADPAGGTAFSDHIALNPQLSLVPATAPVQTLRDVLVQRFRGQRVPIEVVVDFVLKETIFSETSHLKRATLAPLEREKKLDVQRPEGARVIAGQYPRDVDPLHLSPAGIAPGRFQHRHRFGRSGNASSPRPAVESGLEAKEE